MEERILRRWGRLGSCTSLVKLRIKIIAQIRFGESIIIDNKIDDQVKQAFIPPLSFQLLIENAIKHNEVSRARPLRISLTNKDGMLIVKNNLQLRSDEQISNGVGHSNLICTYALLTGKQPKFFTRENEYVAMIPILKSISWSIV